MARAVLPPARVGGVCQNGIAGNPIEGPSTGRSRFEVGRRCRALRALYCCAPVGALDGFAFGLFGKRLDVSHVHGRHMVEEVNADAIKDVLPYQREGVSAVIIHSPAG